VVRGISLADRGRYCLGEVFLLFILGLNLSGVGPVRDLREGVRTFLKVYMELDSYFLFL
jgi:hypothetical protein